MERKRPIVILGGGISGLACAYFLAKKGIGPILILEKNHTVGGLGGFHQTKRFRIEYTYHVTFYGDSHLRELIDELGLTSRLSWFPAKTGFFDGKEVISFSGPWEVLKNRKISLREKLDLAKVYLKLRSVTDWQDLDKIRAKDWLLENCSPPTYEKFFAPILNIKWGTKSQEISVAWLWGRLFPRSTSRNLIGGGERLGYLLPDGFWRLFSRLLTRLRRLGVAVDYGAEIKKINFNKEQIESLEYIKGGKKRMVKPAVVVSTIPPPIFAALAPKLPLQLLSLSKIEYMGVICTLFSLKKSLTGGYYQVPFRPGKTFCGGVVEHTAAITSPVYHGEHLVYAFKYLEGDSKVGQYSDRMIIDGCLADFRAFSGKLLTRKEINWTAVYRNRFATPIYSANFLRRQPPIQFAKGNLFFGGMAVTYPITDFNSSIAWAKKIVQAIL